MPSAESVSARRARRRFRLPAGNVPLTLLAMLALWEISVRVGEVPAYLVPPPSTIVLRMFRDWKLLLEQTWITTTANSSPAAFPASSAITGGAASDAC